MNMPSAKLLVSVADDSVWIRISGRANFTSSIDFKTLVNELRQKNFRRFQIDLCDCVLMDSTFLGVLAGFGLRMNAEQAENEKRPITLLNPNSRISELLENLGVLHLFEIAKAPTNAPSGVETSAPSQAHSAQALAETSLEAHQTLMQISPDNVPKFKDVTQFLAEDLKRLKTRA